MERINEYLTENNLTKIGLSTKFYRNLSIKDIIKNLPKGMSKTHKLEYIINFVKIYVKETLRIDLTVCESLKNYNFRLIQFYLK